FTRLYHTGKLDEKQIQALRRQFRFADVAQAYRLIDDDGAPTVVASWEPKRTSIEELVTQALLSPSRFNLRRLIPYQVNLRRYELQKAGAQLQLEGQQFQIAVWRGSYSCEFGLDAQDDDF